MTSVTNVTAAQNQTQAPEKSKMMGALSDQFDNFLKLLTTQLQHQNPLSPMDNHQFTQQLVQFAIAEQSVATNSKLDEVVKVYKNQEILNAANLVGQEITCEPTDQVYDGKEKVRFSYNLPADTQNAHILVVNDKGRVVRVDQVPAQAGQNTYSWDGRDSLGVPIAPGAYHIEVAAQVNGQILDVPQMIKGTVNRIDVAGPEVNLAINNQLFPLNKIRSIASSVTEKK